MSAVQHLVHGKWSGEERGRAEHRAVCVRPLHARQVLT